LSAEARLLAKADATKQSILSLRHCHAARWIASLTLAMTIVLLFENRIRSDRFFDSSCPGLTRASIIFAKACFEEDGLPGQAPQ